MKKLFQSAAFLFAFNLLYWMGFTYVTSSDGEEWNWTKSILISAGYAAFMTYKF